MEDGSSVRTAWHGKATHFMECHVTACDALPMAYLRMACHARDDVLLEAGTCLVAAGDETFSGAKEYN